MSSTLRVLLDTNVLISYLLYPDGIGPPVKIVEAGTSGIFTMVISTLSVIELQDKVTNKPYLAQRIPVPTMEQFVGFVRDTVEIVGQTVDEHPEVSRDRKDDFLIAHAILAHVDYLVSGDPDLLVLEEFEGIRIVSPAELIEILGL